MTAVTESDTAVAVAVRGLGKRYGTKWALEALDVDLPAGSVTALVGHNGAGKTTLLRLLAGLIAPTCGSFAVGSQPSISYVAQDKPLYPTWRVREIVEFGRRMHVSWDGDLVQAWLSELDVPTDRPCNELSGGQRAQVALGLALGSRPDLLLLDEPMASLDPLARADLVRALLGVVAETGVTVLLSTHQTADLQALADRILLIAGGRRVLDGDVDALMEGHVVIEGPGDTLPVPADAVVVQQRDARRVRATVRRDAMPAALHPAWSVSPVTLEGLLLDHLVASRQRGNA
jgi:ABC-2 type transport system ATP-binding protein